MKKARIPPACSGNALLGVRSPTHKPTSLAGNGVPIEVDLTAQIASVLLNMLVSAGVFRRDAARNAAPKRTCDWEMPDAYLVPRALVGVHRTPGTVAQGSCQKRNIERRPKPVR